MKVFVDNKEIVIFRGAKILDLLRKCGFKKNEIWKIIVVDKFGFQVEVNGPVRAEQEFFTHQTSLDHDPA